jgi:hypothetical protein
MVEILLVVFVGLSAYLFWRLQTQEPEEKIVYKKAKHKKIINLNKGAWDFFKDLANLTDYTKFALAIVAREMLSENGRFFESPVLTQTEKSKTKITGTLYLLDYLPSENHLINGDMVDFINKILTKLNSGWRITMINTETEMRCVLTDKSGVAQGEIIANDIDTEYISWSGK